MNELVSCIMITGHQDRGQFPRMSLASFLEQSYQPRELVIINQNPCEPLVPNDVEQLRLAGCEVREYLIRTECRTLGEMRNEGLERARGEWFIPWDDDDWQHPRRLETMMEMRRPGLALVPSSHIRFSFETFSAWQYDNGRDGTGGTALFPMTSARYPSLKQGEDTRFYLDNFQDRRWIWNSRAFAHAYLRFHHGSNTGTARHVMKGFSTIQHRWQTIAPGKISLDAAKYMKYVLEMRYGVQFPGDMDWYSVLHDCESSEK